MAPPEVELIAASATAQQDPHPGHAAPREVGPHHLGQCPRLQVGSLDRGIQHDSCALAIEPHTEVNVLHPGQRFVESPGGVEGGPADRPEAGPEGADAARRRVMDVMVEQVAKSGDRPGRLRIVVVRAKQGGQPRVRLEFRADAGERIGVHDDIRIDEHEQLMARPLGPKVACRRGYRAGRPIDDDELLGRIVRLSDRRHAAVQRRRPVGRRDDHAQPRHTGILAPIEPETLQEHRPEQIVAPGSSSLPAVVVRGVSKTFYIPPQRHTTVKERLVDRFRSEPSDERRALEDVSFKVSRGEFFGIVGRNGSGKTTLLRCIAGIYDYDQGSIEVSGRLAPFIELRVGFKQAMTARENALLSAVMLGLSKEEATRRLDEIIAFAGLEDSAEMKVRNFSSGMTVRLAFSIAIQVEADVLLVDEVLAVGDAAFKQRCYDELERLKSEGRTLLFVTHSMDAIASHCDRAVLLDSGRIVSIGSPQEIASEYEAINTRNAEQERARADDAKAPETRTSDSPVAIGPPATYRPAAIGDSVNRFFTLTTSLAVAEFKLHYLGSALGYLWSALRPLAYFGILYVLFSKVSDVGSGVENYGVYLLAGIVLWTFFTETVSGGVTSLTRNEGLLRKMRFPRLAIPASIVLRSLFNLGINLLLVAGFVFAVGITPRLSWLEVPLLILLLGLLAGGLGMLLSALYVRYRDASQIWQVARQLLFFGSPILYVAGRYPEAVQEVLSLSPIAVILTQMRHAVVDPDAPSAAASVGGGTLLLIPLAITLGIFCLGLWFFSREAPRVAERL